MARIFVYDGREFPDHAPDATVDEVRRSLADFFPELANATVDEAKRGEDTVYTFTKRIGTKGSAEQDRMIESLRVVPEARLAIYDVARQLIDADGDLNDQAAINLAPDLELASQEAELYAKWTSRAVAALRGPK